MADLPPNIQTAYSELLGQMLAARAERSPAYLSGSITQKRRGKVTYAYFQVSMGVGRKHQLYLGRSDAASVEALRRRLTREMPASRADQAEWSRLASVIVAGGGLAVPGPVAKVLGALADANVFGSGGMLVGTHAFIILGQALGQRWPDNLWLTEDVDIAAQVRLGVALPAASENIPGALEALNMGFLPIPQFAPEAPSTWFRVRGKRLRVDVVTSGRGDQPIPLPAFNTFGAPRRDVGLLLDSPMPAVAVASHPTLVTVPEPAPYALHKLVSADDRPAHLHSKADKDLRQAKALLVWLKEHRPSDLQKTWVRFSRSKKRRTAMKRSLEKIGLARTIP